MAPRDELLRECLGQQQQTGNEDQAEEVPWQDKTLRVMYKR